MSDHDNSLATTVMAFFAGALVGATAALILAPDSGRETRRKLSDLGEAAADDARVLAREVKYRLSPKTKFPDYRYDGGDAWV